MDRHDTIYKEVKFYTAVLSTIISGYSIFSALREQSKINTLRNRISLVESRPVYTPTTLMAELKSSYPERNFKALRNIEGKLTGYRGDVLLAGNVGLPEGEKALKTRNASYFGKNPEFVLKLDSKEDIFSNDSGDASREKYKVNLERSLRNSKVQFIPQFTVSDYKNEVEVSNYDRIDYQKALQVTYIKEERRSLHVHEFVFTLGLLGLKFMTQLFFKNVDPSGFRGISIGIRDTEVGIKIGSGIAVIGELIYDYDSNKMRIDMPQMIVGDRLSFLNSMRAKLEEMVYNRNIFVVIGAVTGVYALRRLFKYLQRLDKLPKKFDSWRS